MADKTSWNRRLVGHIYTIRLQMTSGRQSRWSILTLKTPHNVLKSVLPFTLQGGTLLSLQNTITCLPNYGENGPDFVRQIGIVMKMGQNTTICLRKNQIGVVCIWLPPKAWLVTLIEFVGKTKPLPSIGEAFAEVRREECRKHVMMIPPSSPQPDSHPPGSALAAPRSQCGDHCKKSYHTKETWWKLHGKQANWKPRSPNPTANTAGTTTGADKSHRLTYLLNRGNYYNKFWCTLNLQRSQIFLTALLLW